MKELTTVEDEAPKAESPVVGVLLLWLDWVGVSKVMDLMNVTWHISG